MTTTKRIRPGWRTEADQSVHGRANGSILSADGRLVALLNGTFVVVVDLGGDRMKRRVYLNLPSAQRAADRAVERGHTARVVLCELAPLGVIE